MLRQQTRMRREYLYRKANEDKDQQIYERKQQLKNALASGKALPTELRQDAVALRNELVFDDAQTAPITHIDDEYARAGVQDPKILITTSRDPSSRLRQFAKEVRLLFPNSQRVNRGSYVLPEIVAACKANDVSDLVILHETRGIPDGLIVSHFPHGPTVYFTLHNVVLRHDIENKGTVSEAYPHLVFEGFSSKLGERVQNVLKYLFPVPKDDSARVMTFANEGDFISFRHHLFHKFHKEVQLAEVGPRFELRLYEIKLGTIDMTQADTEWVLRPYQNTSRKTDKL